MIPSKATLSLLLSAAALSAGAFTVDWDKITHWTGEGSNRSALVVQFFDNGPQEAYIWGFRWNPDDYEGGQPSGEDMFRAIASSSDDLLLFTQYTGWMGSTVDGIGFHFPGEQSVLGKLAFNFESAAADPRISFDYYNPNTLMGQTSAPGMFTPVYCSAALTAAESTNIIEHPINALEYGYPAYDYDWWQPSEQLNTDQQRWNAGWYDGYWSYWVGGVNSDELSYSGLGYSSRKLSDGQIDAWKYATLDGPITARQRDGRQNVPRTRADGYSGASEQWFPLNYSHQPKGTGVGDINATMSTRIGIFSVDGTTHVSATPETFDQAIDRLPKGIYVVRQGNKSTKLLK